MKKQKSGLYRAKITVNGKAIYLSAHTVKELEQKKQEARCKFITGDKPKEYTFHNLVTEWWEEIKLPSLSRPGTIAGYKCIVNHWILGQTDPRQMAQAVRRVDLQRVMDSAVSRCNAHRISILKTLMVEICQYGMQVGAMNVNYAINCKVNSHRQVQKKQALEPEQIKTLLQHAPNYPRIYGAILCMYYLGLRYGQAMGLTWGDIDWSAGQVHVHQQIDSCDHQVHETKTSCGNRMIPMPDEFVRIMQPMRQHPSAFVVPYMQHRSFRIEWIKLLEQCGHAYHIEGNPTQHIARNYVCAYTPHQLRHTYITVLYEAGVDPVAASRIAGHSSYSVTADIYTSISERKKRQDAQNIRNAFSKVSTEVAQEK